MTRCLDHDGPSLAEPVFRQVPHAPQETQRILHRRVALGGTLEEIEAGVHRRDHRPIALGAGLVPELVRARGIGCPEGHFQVVEGDPSPAVPPLAAFSLVRTLSSDWWMTQTSRSTSAAGSATAKEKVTG